MKRTTVWQALVAAGLLILAGTPALAEFDLGVLFGWSTTDWDYEVPGLEQEGDIFDGKNAYQAGLFAAAPLTEVLGVRLEALYARKGAGQSLPAMSDQGQPLGTLDVYYNAEYLQVPLLLTVVIGEGESIRPVLFAGPYLGWKIDANVTTSKDFVDPLIDLEGDLDGVSSSDSGFVFGGGFELRAGEQVLHFQARYDLGTEEVFYSANNEAWTIMAGLGF